MWVCGLSYHCKHLYVRYCLLHGHQNCCWSSINFQHFILVLCIIIIIVTCHCYTVRYQITWYPQNNLWACIMYSARVLILKLDPYIEVEKVYICTNSNAIMKRPKLKDITKISAAVFWCARTISSARAHLHLRPLTYADGRPGIRPRGVLLGLRGPGRQAESSSRRGRAAAAEEGLSPQDGSALGLCLWAHGDCQNVAQAWSWGHFAVSDSVACFASYELSAPLLQPAL